METANAPQPGETLRVLLYVACLACLYSLAGTLFFSWGAWLFGAASFVFAAIVGLSRRTAAGASAGQGEWNRAMGILGAVFFACLLGMLIVSPTRVCDTGGKPIFEERDHYYLAAGHRRKMEVSRLRFVTKGTLFLVGWHSMALLALLSLVPGGAAAPVRAARPPLQ
jgi:hypothetical protein